MAKYVSNLKCTCVNKYAKDEYNLAPSRLLLRWSKFPGLQQRKRSYGMCWQKSASQKYIRVDKVLQF